MIPVYTHYHHAFEYMIDYNLDNLKFICIPFGYQQIRVVNKNNTYAFAEKQDGSLYVMRVFVNGFRNVSLAGYSDRCYGSRHPPCQNTKF